MNICKRAIIFSLSLFFFISGMVWAAGPPVLKGKSTSCVLLGYDYVYRLKDFPILNVPDNALLVLTGAKGVCEPMSLSVEQNGKVYPAVGSESCYLWGAFHSVYFDEAFDKFSPYKLHSDRPGDRSELAVEGAALTSLTGQAKRIRKVAWQDPISEEAINKTDVLDLAELLSYGRFVEYADEALYFEKEGGAPRLRREARSALDAGATVRAACLFTMALKWAPTLEPPETRNVSMFQDWALLARSFHAMKRPSAAIRAYDEALKIKKDPAIVQEREQVMKESEPPPKKPPAPYRSGLSEVELDNEKHGTIPIPESEGELIEGGVKANGVYLGDHVDFVIAQCGEPSERFADMVIYFNHPVCPQSIFISPQNRVYSIRTYRGKIPKAGAVGDNMDAVAKRIGPPDRKEPIVDEAAKQVGSRWIYLKLKTAFVDLDGDGKVDAIDVFDYSFL